MAGHDHPHVAAHRAHTDGQGSRLLGWAWLSIAAAVVTIALKLAAYWLTGSVGLLSDALESLVNLGAAILALIALAIAAKPPDQTHHFGHGKVEYFSAGAEGLLIMLAAVLITWSAVERLFSPEPLQSLGIGLLITLVATTVNGVVGLLILRAGRRARSIALEADGKHLITDVWTSVGVVVGVGLVAVTGWLALDSIVAIAVAANIMWTGVSLIRRSVHGLMDRAVPAAEQRVVHERLAQFTAAGTEVAIHGVQMRESGRDRFVSMHVLVPGAWTVARAHDLAEDVEAAVRSCLPGAIVQTHLEPVEDPRSYGDVMRVD